MKQHISFSATPSDSSVQGSSEGRTIKRRTIQEWLNGLTARKILLGFALFLCIALGLNWGLPLLQPHIFHGTVLQPTATVQDFRLDTTLGKPMQLSDFRGKYVLLYFGYTFCPDVCPLTLSELQTTVTELGQRADDQQVIFISVDPARDTVEQLASYLPHFNSSFIGMTGTEEGILQAATQFGIFYDIGEATNGGYYTVDHTSTVVVIDPEGYARLVFPYGVTGKEMAEDLRYLMR